jgi:hypothetical protein
MWGYPWCHIVVTGMGMGSPYPMGDGDLPIAILADAVGDGKAEEIEDGEIGWRRWRWGVVSALETDRPMVVRVYHP